MRKKKTIDMAVLPGAKKPSFAKGLNFYKLFWVFL